MTDAHTTREGILPCPLCGSPATLHGPFESHNDGWLECDDRDGCGLNLHGGTSEALAHRWNTRTPERTALVQNFRIGLPKLAVMVIRSNLRNMGQRVKYEREIAELRHDLERSQNTANQYVNAVEKARAEVRDAKILSKLFPHCCKSNLRAILNDIRYALN